MVSFAVIVGDVFVERAATIKCRGITPGVYAKRRGQSFRILRAHEQNLPDFNIDGFSRH